MRAPGALVDKVAALVEHHLAPALFIGNQATAKGYRRLARKLERAGVGIELLVRVAQRPTISGAPPRTHWPAASMPATHSSPPRAPTASSAPRRATRSSAGTSSNAACGRVRDFGPILERCREIQDETGWTDPDRILDRALAGAGSNSHRGP